MHGSIPSKPIFALDDGPWKPKLSHIHRRQIQRAAPYALGVTCLLMIIAYIRLSQPEPPPEIPGPPPEVYPRPPADDSEERPKFYSWDTVSFFDPVNMDTKGKAVHDICRSFPQHRLEMVQPVLKLGHGDMNTASLKAQMHSVSACLDNLLIFSDLEEHVPGGHTAYDVLGDLPAPFLQHPDFGNYTFMKHLQSQGQLDVDEEATARIDGWILDKYKFLPMLERTWAMRPQRPWYVFYETDTYVFWDNMFRFLDNLDPDTPHYIGSPSPGRQIPYTEKQSWFANGGPGFVLSRAAVQKLMERKVGRDGDFIDAPLSHRWRDLLNIDCCGDSVVGWALYNAGVNVSGFWPMFNPHPAHGVPFEESYWCEPILTLHKTLPTDVEAIWRWEHTKRQHSRPIIYRDLFEFYHLGHPSVIEDWDNSDWAPIEEGVPEGIESFEACGQACEENPECWQYTFHGDRCTLVKALRYGFHRDPDQDTEERKGGRYFSGWLPERIDQYHQERTCPDPEWVRPSMDRIF